MLNQPINNNVIELDNAEIVTDKLSQINNKLF